MMSTLCPATWAPFTLPASFLVLRIICSSSHTSRGAHNADQPPPAERSSSLIASRVSPHDSSSGGGLTTTPSVAVSAFGAGGGLALLILPGRKSNPADAEGSPAPRSGGSASSLRAVPSRGLGQSAGRPRQNVHARYGG